MPTAESTKATVTAKPEASKPAAGKTKTVVEGPKAPQFKPKEIVYATQSVTRKKLTIKECKTIVGWKELDKTQGSHFKDRNGTYVQLWNCEGNREVEMPWVYTLAQIILNHQFKYNGQPIIIGQYGNVITGMHRIVAAVIADQMRQHPDEIDHWKEKGWNEKTAVTIEVLVITGMPEDQDFTSTIDYVRPRTDGDILYCNLNTFAKDRGTRERSKRCKIAAAAIRKLWQRTGRNDDEYSPQCVPTELTKWFHNHPSIEDAVVTVDEDNADNAVVKYCTLGEAASLLYLMGASGSSFANYRDAGYVESALALEQEVSSGSVSANGKPIRETMWERACTFFHNLSARSERVLAIAKFFEGRRKELAEIGEDISPDECVATLVKGWNKYLHLPDGPSLTVKDVKPAYRQDKDDPNRMVIDEHPCITDGKGGGIDRGPAGNPDRNLNAAVEAPVDNPVVKEVNKAKADKAALHEKMDKESPAEEKARRQNAKKKGK